jgi:hypothetical protein
LVSNRSLGLLREAIDVAHAKVNGHDQPTANASEADASDADASDADASHSGATHGFTAYSHDPTADAAGRLRDEPCAWAVWTYEWFQVRRYGFPTEAAARAALDEWITVRVLTHREEEVGSRSRWNSDGLLAIRTAIAANK